MHIPQFKLRSVFAAIVSLSIGLAIGFSPLPTNRPYIPSIYFTLANCQSAFLAAAAVAILIGLVQQACQLAAAKHLNAPLDRKLKFALNMAIGWRALIALLIGICLVTQLLALRRIVELPESGNLFYSEAFPATVLMTSLILVLCEVTRRRSGNSISNPIGTWINVSGWIAATIFALMVLPQSTLVWFLVHTATAGIEANIRYPFQRHGTFPNHLMEGFRLFWLSAAAVATVLVAAWSWFTAGGYASNWIRDHKIRLAAIVAGVLFSLAFCLWFYRYEFFRVSPDMAGAMPAGNWLELLAGGTILLILITSAAFRMSADPRTSLLVPGGAATPTGTRFFHESPFSVALVIAIFAIDLIQYAVVSSNFFGITGSGFRISSLLNYLLAEPQRYFDLALSLLGLQLGIQIWRQRGTEISWRIAGISAKKFAVNWGFTAVLAAVAIPTISAYCFTFWLGPWYRFGP